MPSGSGSASGLPTWRVLVDEAPAGVNIGEWAKREECWKAMRAVPYEVPSDLTPELTHTATSHRDSKAAPADDEKVARVAALGGQGWLALHNWSRQTGSLETWQRNLANDISRRLLSGRPPTSKQSEYAGPILDEAEQLGFTT